MDHTIEDRLCEHCHQALLLDDERAGGSISSDFWIDRSEATLTHHGFQRDRWKRVSDTLYQKRSPRDSEPTYDVAYMASRRSATPPDLAALSDQTCKSGSGICQFCQALKSAFVKRYHSEPWWNQEASRLRFLIRYDWKDGPSSLENTLRGVTVLVWRPGLENGDLEFFAFRIGAEPGRCRDWLGIRTLCLEPNNPLSDRNVALFNGWLKHCVAHHKNCKRPADSSILSFIPTRLLHFSLDSTNDHATLVDGAMMRESLETVNNISYAALSYCWGAGVTSKTTKENLAERQVEISISALPLVFRQAILVARRLGLLYLWIDALCIVQNDPPDWERESSAMPYIFAYAFVTIGAAASDACDASFLHRATRPTLQIPFQSELLPEIRGEYTLSLEPYNSKEAERDFSELPWNGRAWVFQEQRLASRILIFGKSMLQLRCRENCWVENQLSWPSCRQYDFLRHLPNELWNIEQYTRRKLTYRRDRLGAMAGVARLLGKAAREDGDSDQYLAGLWLDPDTTGAPDAGEDECSAIMRTFGEQLCWMISKPTDTYEEMKKSLEMKETYCAPSWSWASREQEISYMFVLKQSDIWFPLGLFQLVRWDLPPAQSDAMVAVKPGSSITIRGFMRPFITSAEDDTRNISEPDRSASLGDIGRMIFEHSAESQYHLDWTCDTERLDEDLRKQLKILFVLIHRQDIHNCSIYGLLLLPESHLTEEDAVFHRSINMQDRTYSYQLFSRAEGKKLHTDFENACVLHQVYRRVGAFKSCGRMDWIHYCQKVEVMII